MAFVIMLWFDGKSISSVHIRAAKRTRRRRRCLFRCCLPPFDDDGIQLNTFNDLSRNEQGTNGLKIRKIFQKMLENFFWIFKKNIDFWCTITLANFIFLHHFSRFGSLYHTKKTLLLKRDVTLHASSICMELKSLSFWFS